MLSCNLNFFLGNITGEINPIHPVEKRSWNSIKLVGRTDKQNL